MRSPTNDPRRGLVLDLVRRGYTDRQIALEIHVRRTTISDWRRWAGLPANERDRSELLYRRQREAIRRRGWPPDIGTGGVRIVESLCDHGPQFANDLTEGKHVQVQPGGRKAKSKELLKHLEDHGLIHRVFRVIGVQTVVFPTQHALSIRKAFLEAERDDNRSQQTD